MPSVSKYQRWRLEASPGDVMLAADYKVCDENLKSETRFQTASTLVSSFCHALLPFIYHTVSAKTETLSAKRADDRRAAALRMQSTQELCVSKSMKAEPPQRL